MIDAIAQETFARDITDRRHHQEQREQLQLRAHRAQHLESLIVLTEGIAHNFNNLLTVILGNASVTLAGLSSASPIRNDIEQIQVAAVRAAHLCKQMLAFTGQGNLLLKVTGLSQLVEKLRYRLKVSVPDHVVLSYHLPTDLPVVEVDILQMQQVLMDLVVNAADAIATEAGVIYISTDTMEASKAYLSGTVLEEDRPEGTYVFLEVSDTGSGMDTETQRRLFDPFFSTKATGRGLGMAAALGIVRGHRGTIKVSSEVGTGTTIRVLLPMATPASDKPAKCQQHVSTTPVQRHDSRRG